MNHRWTEGVRREVLPNGLTLLVQRDGTAPAVAVVCYVRAGFFDEPDRLAGVSHVLEHMLFKGTPTRGVGAIARETKAAGGYLNAGTGYDHTSYYTVLPAAALPVALDLQSDALRRSLLDPEELRRELRVIIEEAKRKLDNPSAVTAETLHAVLFDHHRIRRWRIGTEAQLAGLSSADVQGYYRSRYVPGRTIVAMAGDLDPEEALEIARESFGSWPAAEAAVDRSPDEPPLREIRTRTLRGDVRRAELALGWRSVPATHPDAPALDVAAALLGAGRASWLYRALREPGVVTSVGAHHYSPTEVGVFSIGADLVPARLNEALEGAAGCITRLRLAGPSQDDLARVRRLLRARWARRLESVEGKAAALAAAEAQGGVHLLDEEYDRLLAVGADQVRQVAADWLAPDAVRAVLYLPTDAAEELDAATVRRAFAKTTWPGASGSEPPDVPLPAATPIRGTTASGVLHIPLPGADLLIGRKPGVPLVSLGVYRRRTVPDVLTTAGLGALAVRTAVRGAGDFSAGDLALAFEGLGGGLAPQVAADWFGFGTSVLSDHAGEAAALLDLVLTSPRFDPEEVEREQGTLAEEASQAADDMVRYPMQLAFRAGFGDAGYGLPVHGLADIIPTFTPGMARAWHACEMATGRTTIVAVGDLHPERFGEQLAGIFGRASAREIYRGSRFDPAALVRPRPARTVEKRTKRQTAIAMLYPGPSRSDPARYTAEVWAAIASGMGGRLFSALRDRRSLAYSVMASSWQRVGAGALLLYIATSPEREDEARGALLEELARFRTEVPEANELGRAVNYLAGQAQVQRQTAGALAGEIADAWLLGWGLEELADPTAGFRRVTAAEVGELAERHLDPEWLVEGVVRGAPAA